ncbi:hypothetical protein LINGRAHAP2_LOCUS27158 [Linum grandiflorum]
MLSGASTTTTTKMIRVKVLELEDNQGSSLCERRRQMLHLKSLLVTQAQRKQRGINRAAAVGQSCPRTRTRSE